MTKKRFASRSEARRHAAQKAARHPELYAIVQAWLRGEINQEQFDRQYSDAEAIVAKLLADRMTKEGV